MAELLESALVLDESPVLLESPGVVVVPPLEVVVSFFAHLSAFNSYPSLHFSHFDAFIVPLIQSHFFLAASHSRVPTHAHVV